ncbi:MAG: hypothetical protein GY941_26240 [Planctomycetes bacterium]|nr:hypothetical protein [Planctomycetota bacterium]
MQMNRFTIFFPLIFVFLTYYSLGYENKESYANSTTQKKVSSAQKTNKGGDAVKRFEEILESDPDNHQAHYNLGILYEANFMLGASLNAEASFKEALEVNPEFVEVHSALELSYLAHAMYGEAYHHAEIHKKKPRPLSHLTLPVKQSTAISENSISWGALPELTKTPQAQNLTISSINEAIYYSAKTEMLSMLMAKLYGVQVLKDFPNESKRLAKRHLNDAKRMMNEIYMAFFVFPPVINQPELEQTIRTAQTYWIQLEKVLLKPPSKTGFLDVLDISDNLLDKNDIISKYLENIAPHPQSKLINMAGKLQMYTMKLVRDYLAASMGIEKQYRVELLLDAAIEFQDAMLTIEDASENTAKIKGLIKSITKMEWRIVYKTVTECIESNGTKFNILLMIDFCDKLLEKTKRLTNLYAMSRNTSYDEATTTTKDRSNDKATTTKDRSNDKAATTTKDRSDDKATTTTKDRSDDKATTTKDRSNFPFSNRR